MKLAISVLVLVAIVEVVLSAPGYGPPQPLPSPHNYRPPNGAPIPAKYPPFPGAQLGKNEFYSKYNPHSLPPGVRGPPPQSSPPFGKFPLSSSGKPQPQYLQQKQLQQQQQQLHYHHQQQQQQQQQQQLQQKQQLHKQQSHHQLNHRPLGPQLQSKPHLITNGAISQGQIGNNQEHRVHQGQPRPSSKITNVWPGSKLSSPPDIPSRFPTAVGTAPVTVAAPAPFPVDKPSRSSYIINSDDERGPIKTIPAPNLNPSNKPANFDDYVFKIQPNQHSYNPLDNSITDEKLSYQVTEDPSTYKPFSGQPSYFAPDPDTVAAPKVPPTTDSNSLPSVGKVPLDIALQQHLDKQYQQQSAEQVGSADTLTPQELYTLLNGNQMAGSVVPQATYMVQQPVMYAIPQPQVGHQQVQYQPQAVQLQYAQPAAADLQYLQPQNVHYQTQPVQYQPQTVLQYQQYQQQQPVELQYGAQPDGSVYGQSQEQLQQKSQPQQYQEQPQQYQQQQQPQQYQQQQQPQQYQQQQQPQQQPQDDDVQYQRDREEQDYEPRNVAAAAKATVEQNDGQPQEQKKFENIRNQYYSAVPNEQTAGVLAQIAESAAANSDDATAAATADETKRVDAATAEPEAEKSSDPSTSRVQTSVQIQQSVPLYEGEYASSRRSNQEYVDEDGGDELMEGSESASVSKPSSSNGHAPSQFPYSAANINAFASD